MGLEQPTTPDAVAAALVSDASGGDSTARA